MKQESKRLVESRHADDHLRHARALAIGRCVICKDPLSAVGIVPPKDMAGTEILRAVNRDGGRCAEVVHS